jgi:hypothetical protein
VRKGDCLHLINVFDKAGKAEKRWYLWIPALALLVAIPFSLTIYFGAHSNLGLFLIAIPVFLLFSPLHCPYPQSC